MNSGMFGRAEPCALCGWYMIVGGMGGEGEDVYHVWEKIPLILFQRLWWREGVVAETIVVRELLRNPVGEPWGEKGAIPHPLDQG